MKTCPLCGRRTALPLTPHIKECHALAIAAERERCAKIIADEIEACDEPVSLDVLGQVIMATIRKDA